MSDIVRAAELITATVGGGIFLTNAVLFNKKNPWKSAAIAFAGLAITGISAAALNKHEAQSCAPTQASAPLKPLALQAG